MLFQDQQYMLTQEHICDEWGGAEGRGNSLESH